MATVKKVVVKAKAPAVHTAKKTGDELDERLDVAAKKVKKAAPKPREPDEVIVPTRPKPPPLPARLIGDVVKDLVDNTGPSSKEGKSAKAVLPGYAKVLGDSSCIEIPGVVSTQVASLDAAIGRGGWPMARVTTLTSDNESSGKTSLLLHGLAETQNNLGGLGLFIEKENKVDSSLVRALIGAAPQIILSKPPYLERAFDAIERFMKKLEVIKQKVGWDVPGFIGVDSLDGFDIKDEYDLEIAERYQGQPIAPVPKVMSRNLPRLTDILEKKRVACVWICQSRSKVNVRFGKQTSQTGGKALKFHSALIVHVANTGKLKKGKRDVGIKMKAMVSKNNVAAPYLATEFQYIFGKGANRSADLVNYALSLDVMEKSGAWISFEGLRRGQGVDEVAAVLDKRPDLFEKVLDKVHDEEAKAKAEGRMLARAMTAKEKLGTEDDEEDGGDEE